MAETSERGDTTRGLGTSSREPTGSSGSDTFPCLGQVGGRVLREGFLKMERTDRAMNMR